MASNFDFLDDAPTVIIDRFKRLQGEITVDLRELRGML